MNTLERARQLVAKGEPEWAINILRAAAQNGPLGAEEQDLLAELETSVEQNALAPLVAYVTQRLANGGRPYQVAVELSSTLEWSHETAAKFVSAVQGETADEYIASPLAAAAREGARAQHRKQMLHGSLWMLGGAVISLFTYAAAEGGGTYFLFWGAVLWGAIDFMRGLFGWLANRG